MDNNSQIFATGRVLLLADKKHCYHDHLVLELDSTLNLRGSYDTF